jgi:hypothetical protein
MRKARVNHLDGFKKERQDRCDSVPDGDTAEFFGGPQHGKPAAQKQQHGSGMPR